MNWAKPYNLSDYFSMPSCIATQLGTAAHLETKQRGQADGSTKTIGFVEASSSNRSQSDKIVRLDVNSYTYFTESLFTADIGKNIEVHTNSFHWKDVVRNQAFEERAASLNLSNLSQAKLFKLAIDELFKSPTSTVTKSFESLMRRLAGGQPNDVPYVASRSD